MSSRQRPVENQKIDMVNQYAFMQNPNKILNYRTDTNYSNISRNQNMFQHQQQVLDFKKAVEDIRTGRDTNNAI